MLRLVTRKLRTHSLHERDEADESHEEDAEEGDGDGDGDTEGDDEGGATLAPLLASARPPNEPRPNRAMSARDEVISPADTACSASSRSGSISTTTDSPYFMMTGADLQYDQHSSEEELEVINNTPNETYRNKYGTRPQSTAPPEKRKWEASQCAIDADGRDPDGLASPFTANLSVAENDENAASAHNAAGESAVRSPDGGALPAPVRFRTSPPLEALKPRRAEARLRGLPPLAALGARACSCCAPPPQPPNNHHLLPYDVSPRKRSRHSRRHVQRPCLDFDKMQQLKVRAVTAWRHGGAEHGGELSVFCW